MISSFQKVISAVVLTAFAGLSHGADEESLSPIFSVRFGEKDVNFSGYVVSEEAGQAIASAVRSVRPDLGIVNGGMKVDASKPLPSESEIIGMLTELGLSTHGGRLELGEDYLLLAGLTDSPITVTALQIRISPLLETRRFINRTCIVASGDLPDIKISLSSGELEDQLLDFEFHPTAVQAFASPGLEVEKLLPTLLMLSDFDRLEGKKKAPLIAQPLRAMPVSKEEVSPASIIQALALPEEPTSRFEMIDTIRFSRNSFLLQANQQAIAGQIAEKLTKGGWANYSVRLDPVLVSGGSGAFNEYITEKRAAEVKKMLGQQGVNPQRISIETKNSSETMDRGEVHVLVEIPPPPKPEPEEETAIAEGEAGENPPGHAPDSPPGSPSGLRAFRLKVGG